MLISFIVPVYNVAPYLERCLISIVHQGLKQREYEIILINDGSTDSSLKICEHFSKMQPNVIVRSQHNSGVSSARNAGIAVASGKWICFVDSDDYLNIDAISSVLQLFEGTDADMVRYWSRIVSEKFVDNQVIPGSVNFKGTGLEFIKKFGMDSFCYNYLYNRQWLLKTGILFDDVRIAEDYLFVSQLLLLNPNIISTTVTGYNYVKHSSSITWDRKPEHTASLARSYPQVIEKLFDYENELQIDDSDVKYQVLKSAQDKIRSFISRVLSSNIDSKEFMLMVKQFKVRGVLPIRIKGNWKNRIITHAINWICCHPGMLKLSRRLYDDIFIPFILPRIMQYQSL